MCRLKFFFAESATRTCISREMSGVSQLIHACPDTRSSVAWRKRVAKLRNLKKAIGARSVAWWTHAGRVRIEMIPMENINKAYERMLKSDVKYRFVIDVASLR